MNDNYKFLVIDDSEPILEVYTQLLQTAGHQVTPLNNCTQALMHVQTLQPDCVICDLILPGMDGLELFQQIRQQTEIKQPVFIIISAKQYDYDKRHALKLGVDAYLTKPIDHAGFAREIASIIQTKLRP